MIIEGKKGSLVFFFNDVLICGFPIGRYNYDDYKAQSNELVLNSFIENYNIKQQINNYMRFVSIIYHKKIDGKKISGMDLQIFAATCLALIKFKVLDEDDIVFQAIKKRNRGKIKVFNQYIPDGAVI